jgi:hypothetical protein
MKIWLKISNSQGLLAIAEGAIGNDIANERFDELLGRNAYKTISAQVMTDHIDDDTRNFMKAKGLSEDESGFRTLSNCHAYCFSNE